MMVMAEVLLSASATASVPLAKAGNSNTPMGPFQMTVPASATASQYSFTVSGPMSKPSQPSGISPALTTWLLASGAKASAQTVSTGSSSFTPLALAFSIMSLE